MSVGDLVSEISTNPGSHDAHAGTQLDTTFPRRMGTDGAQTRKTGIGRPNITGFRKLCIWYTETRPEDDTLR